MSAQPRGFSLADRRVAKTTVPRRNELSLEMGCRTATWGSCFGNCTEPMRALPHLSSVLQRGHANSARAAPLEVWSHQHTAASVKLTFASAYGLDFLAGHTHRTTHSRTSPCRRTSMTVHLLSFGSIARSKNSCASRSPCLLRSSIASGGSVGAFRNLIFRRRDTLALLM